MEKFKYLGVTFSSDDRQDNKLDTHIGKASVVMCQLYQLVVLKWELCTKAKLSVFRSIFVYILTYGHECWVMTKRVRSRVQAAKMGFLQKVRGLFLLDKVKSTDIRQSLNIELLLLCIEQSQLYWYGHKTWISHKQTAKELKMVFRVAKGLEGDPELTYRITLQTWPSRILESIDGIAASCRRSGCLEITARAGVPATPKG